MDCAGVSENLVGYHFATIDDGARDAVDAHLLECQGCLRTYLALKRATEDGAAERPSQEARARLRAEVMRTFPSKRASVGSLLKRRIPVYQGLVAVAVAAAFALLVPAVIRRLPRDVREGVPAVDTSRPRAESLQIY